MVAKDFFFFSKTISSKSSSPTCLIFAERGPSPIGERLIGERSGNENGLICAVEGFPWYKSCT